MVVITHGEMPGRVRKPKSVWISKGASTPSVLLRNQLISKA